MQKFINVNMRKYINVLMQKFIDANMRKYINAKAYLFYIFVSPKRKMRDRKSLYPIF